MVNQQAVLPDIQEHEKYSLEERVSRTVPVRPQARDTSSVASVLRSLAQFLNDVADRIENNQ